MSVRDQNAPLRRQAVQRREPGSSPPGPRRGIGASQILVTILFIVFLVGTVGFIVAALGPQPTRTPDPSAFIAASGSAHPSGAPQTLPPSVPAGSTDPATSGDPSTSIDPSASPSPSAPPVVEDVLMPIVPVVGFWESGAGLSRAELTAALEGSTDRFSSVIVPQEDRAAIGAALGIDIAASVSVGDADAIATALGEGALGLMRAADVTPRVRAIPLEGKELFGNDRLDSTLDWPLTVTVDETADRLWDQSAAVTVVVGGDSMMDRGIYERVVNRGKGSDYPFDGGTAEITGRYCCGPFVCCYEVPSFEKTGNAGIVRRLVEDADLTMINLENPLPDNWVFHLHGTPFSGDPELLDIFTRVNIDFMSLANNHMYDYGTSGIADTLRHLGRTDIEFAGAGMDLEEARRYSVLDAGSSRVAILPCVMITPGVWAQEDRAGAMPCQDDQLVPNIQEASTLADIVIVFPSWGPEYTPDPYASQRRRGARWIAAGADVVVGFGHHMVGSMEESDGKLIFYSVGNFIFDQNWAEFTMEGILPELTFAHGDLVQVEMNPFLTADQAQPNLLDAEGARHVLGVIERASEGYLDY